MRPVHPGEILGEELEELGLSASGLAKALDVPTNRVTAVLKGQRGVTADTALRLSRYFGTTPHLWQNLQKAFSSCGWRRSNRGSRSRSECNHERRPKWAPGERTREPRRYGVEGRLVL